RSTAPRAFRVPLRQHSALGPSGCPALRSTSLRSEDPLATSPMPRYTLETAGHDVHRPVSGRSATTHVRIVGATAQSRAVVASTAATAAQIVRTWFHAVHGRWNTRQAAALSSARTRRSLSGTLRA